MKIKILGVMLFLVFVLAACSDTEGSAVSVTEGYITLEVGETYALDVTVSGAEGNTVSYQSKDPNVASVSEEGVVTAVGGGETLITVRAGSSSDFVVVRVSGDRVVAFDEMDFLSALEQGEYRIELQKDLVFTETIEVDRPFEIVFNGYTLEADFKVVADFVGGLAFNNALSEDRLMSLTEEDLQAYKGTVDLNGFLVEVYVNFLQMFDPETFNDYVINPFGVTDRVYTYQYDYVNVGDQIPVANANDLLNIQSNSPHVFAEGTPYERLIAIPRMYQNYVLVNDIQGELTPSSRFEVIERAFDENDSSDEVYVFRDGVLEDSYENFNSPQFQIEYNNALFQLNEGLPTDIPLDLDAAIQTYLTDNAITAVNYYEITKFEYQVLENEFTLLNNVKIFGNDYTIRYFEFEDGDALFDEASGEIELKDLTIEYLVGSSTNGDDQGLIFNYASTNLFSLVNVEINYNYYQALDAGSDNFGILVGFLASSDNFEMFNVAFIGNQLFSDETGDTGIVFGEIEDTNGRIGNIDLVGNLLVQDGGENDLGIFAGFMDWATFTVNEYYSLANTIDAPDASDSGIFVGTMDQTFLTLNVIQIYENNFIGEDNLGLLVGDIYNSSVFMNEVDVSSNRIKGLNDIGLLFGEMNNVRFEGVNVDISNSFIDGTYYLGGIIGELNDGSLVDLTNIYMEELNINGTYGIAGILGRAYYSNVLLNDVDIELFLASGLYEIGSIIGTSEYSTLDFSRTNAQGITMRTNYYGGGIVGGIYYSHLTTSNAYVNDINVLPYTEIVSDLSDIGGILGIAENTYVELYEVEVNLSNTLQIDEYYGGVAGKFESGTLIVRNSGFFSTVEAVSDSIGGSLGQVTGSNIMIVNSSHELFVSGFEGASLNRIGGLAGEVIDSIVKIEETSFLTGITDGAYNVGGFIGSTLRTHVETIGLYINIDIVYDITLVEFDDTKIGEMIGYAEEGRIEIYYSNLTVVETALNGEIDLFNSTFTGIGTYVTNYVSEVDPVVEFIFS